MRASELMVGNLFRVNKDVSFKKGTIVVIRGVDADRTFHDLKGYATCVALGDTYNVQGGVWLEYLKPIQLTPEILEKIGFKWTTHKSYMVLCIGTVHMAWGFYKGCLSISDHSDDGECQISSLKCKFVHQLQQAMRICGIEKEIEL